MLVGVSAPAESAGAVSELFQLLRIPWEPVRQGQRYPAVLVFDPRDAFNFPAELVLIFGAGPCSRDAVLAAEVGAVAGSASIRLPGVEGEAPVYRGCAEFRAADTTHALTNNGGALVGFARDRGGQRVVRLGYDPLAELDFLRESGQPPGLAPVPALELHLELIRKLILGTVGSLVEIPPRPWETSFICCLTHDIDFFGLRRHRLDRTALGFLYRATVKSGLDVLTGRRRWRQLGRNWAAALKTPLVWMGWAEDPWQPLRSYARLESDLPATFFAIPFKGRTGVDRQGREIAGRAIAHDVSDIFNGNGPGLRDSWEIGLHGIDAWRDAEAAAAEAARITVYGGRRELGVRMHWLMFDQASPRALDEAGFVYDSTWGYNEAVGFKAGTAQPFAFPGTRRLLELPLIIQDTALFYSDRMGLREAGAGEACERVLDAMDRWGGALTLDWHDRSLEPERLWGEFYERLLARIQRRQVWFASGLQAANWFRWRRSVDFRREGDGLVVSAPDAGSPPGRIRVWTAEVTGGLEARPLFPAGVESSDQLFAGGTMRLSRAA